MPRHIHCLLIVLLLAALSDSVQAAESEVTARSIFALLPESIFENTPEGLSPQEKQKLLSAGHSEFWEIAGETEAIPPVVLCVVCGMTKAAYKREDGVFVVPITALKP